MSEVYLFSIRTMKVEGLKTIFLTFWKNTAWIRKYNIESFVFCLHNYIKLKIYKILPYM